jgi:hypothetical protein
MAPPRTPSYTAATGHTAIGLPGGQSPAPAVVRSEA